MDYSMTTQTEPTVETKDTALILDVGSGPESVAAQLFPNATVVRLDANADVNPDYVHDITQPLPEELHDKFEIVYLSHVLEHLPYKQIIPVLSNLKQALKPEAGELWVIVPSLEWAAREIAKDQPSPVLMAFLYGSQDTEYQFHKCGFTLGQLRMLMEHVGLYTRRAFQSKFIIGTDIGTDHQRDFYAGQNVVVGLRSN